MKETEHESRVITAQVFEEETRRRVEHDVECEGLPLDVREAAVEQQDGENHHVELPLPDLGGPERLVAVGVMGERRTGVDDAVGHACGRAESVAVQQVRTTAEGLAEDERRCDDIKEVDGVQLMFMGIPDACEHAEENATLDGHASLPDVEDLREVAAVVFPVKEEHIPKPCTEQPCRTAVDAEVDDVLLIAAPVCLGEKIGHTRREDN